MSTSQPREINSNKELTILRFRNVSRKKCWTIVYGVWTGPVISILFSWIHWLSSPDLTCGMCWKQPSLKPLRSMTWHWGGKSPRCRRSKRVHFGYTATSFGKECIEIPSICVKIFEANIIWRSGHAIRSSLLINFCSFHHDCRRAS